MAYTFLDLKTEVKAKIWPNELADNLVASVDGYFTEALIDLQRWVDCMREQQFNVVPQCATLFKCGLTILEAPRGVVKRLCTVQSDYCCSVPYEQVEYAELMAWSAGFSAMVDNPTNEGMPKLNLGLKYPERSTDLSTRALAGKWAIHKGKIYVAPWIQSNEMVVIEWEGIKRAYADTDLVSDDGDFKRAVRHFIQKEYAGEFESDGGKKADATRDYENDRADLMYDCREDNRVRRALVSPEVIDALWKNCSCDTESTSGGTVTYPVIANIGDFGVDGTPLSDVSKLVKGWKPIAIVTTGDNNYPIGAAATIDANIGKYFRSYIHPYLGSQPLGSGETDTDENLFFPCLGNHDLDTVVSSIAGKPYFDYFTLPGNERYYEFVKGGIHFFVLNSGVNSNGDVVEDSGNSSMGAQADWFFAAAARSTVKWKVVVFHHPDYTNNASYSPGLTAMRWNWKAAGINLVLNGHGHGYERLEVNGVPHIVNGASGNGLVGFIGSPTSDSKVRYYADYGALKITNLCSKLKTEFITRTGQLIDTLEITT